MANCFSEPINLTFQMLFDITQKFPEDHRRIKNILIIKPKLHHEEIRDMQKLPKFSLKM